MKKKLKLHNLMVQSFITSVDKDLQDAVRGGNNPRPTPPESNNCITMTTTNVDLRSIISGCRTYPECAPE